MMKTTNNPNGTKESKMTNVNINRIKFALDIADRKMGDKVYVLDIETGAGDNPGRNVIVFADDQEAVEWASEQMDEATLDAIMNPLHEGWAKVETMVRVKDSRWTKTAKRIACLNCYTGSLKTWDLGW